jgi:hypothetical protein
MMKANPLVDDRTTPQRVETKQLFRGGIVLLQDPVLDHQDVCSNLMVVIGSERATKAMPPNALPLMPACTITRTNICIASNLSTPVYAFPLGIAGIPNSAKSDCKNGTSDRKSDRSEQDRSHGSPETVRSNLTRLLDATRADELMMATQLFQLEDRVRSIEMVSEIFQSPFTY